MSIRLLCLALLLVWSLSAAAQDKTLTFQNASPAKTIRLLNGSSVKISTGGNITADCLLSGTSCADTAGGNPPTVTLTPSGYSSAPDDNNRYAPGTSLTLTPNVDGAEVCVRLLQSGSPSDSSWTGAMFAPFAAQSVTVNSQNASYGFILRCYGPAGSASSSTVTVLTRSGGGGEPNCSGITPPAGFARSGPTTWNQLFGDAFPRFNWANVTSVPHNADAGLTFLGAADGKYTSVEFTTPTTYWLDDNGFRWSTLQWDQSQIDHVRAPSAAVPSNAVLITISRCPGDFRVAIENPNPNEPTEAPSCQSVRRNSSGSGWKTPILSMVYNQDGNPSAGCGLKRGTKYYLNYINANPTDGITTGEHTCPNGRTTCGVQLKHQ